MQILHRSSLAAMLVAATVCTTVQAAKPVHIFILSGQSNMAGMNPKSGFEPEAKKLFDDGEVVYLKVAQGGQPIRLWLKQEEWLAICKKNNVDVNSKQVRPPKFYAPILKKYSEILAKHPKPASVTFCWMQGERDAREKLSGAYEDALHKLITNLRRDLKQPKMNFVIGRLSDFGKPGNTHWQAVRKAQVGLANKDPLGSWVDCDDLNNKEKNGKKRDDLHYTKAGYELLGRRYARQAKALVDGKKPADNGRPE